MTGGVTPDAPTAVAAREAALRRLELAVTRRLDGLLHGDHQGLVPGAGSEPGEAREYHAGDDIRRMDWNVYARTTVPHVRETVADRELEAWAVVDQSASLDFGTADCEKRDLALAATAAIGFLTAKRGNRFGVVAVGPGRVERIPARTGRAAVTAALAALAAAPRSPASAARADLVPALTELGRTARRRGLVAVISDFLGEPGTGGRWEGPLRGLVARHEVVAVEVTDPRELELPDVGVLMLVDPETGDRLEVQTSRRLRERFAAAAAADRAEVAAAIRRAGADHLRLSTDRDWLLDVAAWVGARRRRARAGVRA